MCLLHQMNIYFSNKYMLIYCNFKICPYYHTFYRTEKKWMFVWRIWIKRKKLAHGIKRLATPVL